jgi:hypothetical protein
MAVKAEEWVKKTFKSRCKVRVQDGRTEQGRPIFKEADTDRIMIQNLGPCGSISISVEKFAKLFKKAIEGNTTNAKRAEAIAADDKGYTNFIAECTKEGLFK